jgi:hypothetical protein
MWICEHCGADVEEGWEVCWNCTKPRNTMQSSELHELAQANHSINDRAFACPRCQSTKVIPGVQLATLRGLSYEAVVAYLPETPQALLFKGGGSSPIVVDVCTDCGHIALRVAEPAVLWHIYQQMRQNGNDANEE